MPDKARPETATLLPPIKVETLVNGGAGLARHEGRVIFIPHTAAGDNVRCRITKSKKHYAEAELVEIIEPADQRRIANCPVAGICGGCQWQHLPYSEQLIWKNKLFRETLTRQCGVDPDRVLPIVPAPNEWNYRSRVQVKCHNSSAGFITGFYQSKSHSVVAIDSCPIIAAGLNGLLAELRQIFNQTPFANQIHQFDLAIDDEQKRSVTIHYPGENTDLLAEHLRAARLDADLLIKMGAANSLTTVQGSGVLQIQVDDPQLRLNYAAGSFAQVNLEHNRSLVATVLALANLSGKEDLVDLYCGMGNFSLPLARMCGRITGIEESPASITFARQNAIHNQIKNSSFLCAPAEKGLREILKHQAIELILLDPPRQGATGVIKEITQNPVSKLIYVSCDPQTLARDLKQLIAHGYELISSQPFDMFPQTHHCESVTLLQRK
ncbi:MAG: class I SAM-dependent RNA methyltransferase [Deltaproteobacteria bacterium]|nr:class I SAM-dependent RNA methyltransferase [Deltaproteobacteria bacterium]